MGVASGCGCKEVYRFLHNFYLYLLFLAAAALLFVHFECFLFLFQYIFGNLGYKFFTKYKQTYGRLWASHGSGPQKGCT